MLGLTPGPDNVFVLMQSAAHGRKAGFFVVLGLCAGLVVHTAAVALGLAAVFAASASALCGAEICGCGVSCQVGLAGVVGAGHCG